MGGPRLSAGGSATAAAAAHSPSSSSGQVLLQVHCQSKRALQSGVTPSFVFKCSRSQVQQAPGVALRDLRSQVSQHFGDGVAGAGWRLRVDNRIDLDDLDNWPQLKDQEVVDAFDENGQIQHTDTAAEMDSEGRASA